MIRTLAAALMITILTTISAAQATEKQQSSMKSTSVAVSKNGKTATYKKVVKDGVVVEERGNPNLLGTVNLDALMEKARRNGGVWAEGDHRTASRRVVKKNGKTVVDERRGDPKLLDGEHPVTVEELLRKTSPGRDKTPLSPDSRVPGKSRARKLAPTPGGSRR